MPVAHQGGWFAAAFNPIKNPQEVLGRFDDWNDVFANACNLPHPGQADNE